MQVDLIVGNIFTSAINIGCILECTLRWGNQDAVARMKQCNKIRGGNQDALARMKQCNKIRGGKSGCPG